MKNYKISIRISEKMLSEFSKAAIKAGETKASILRKQIQEASISNLMYLPYKNHETKGVSFMLEISEDIFLKIDGLSIALGVSRSEVACRIITNFLNSTKSSGNTDDSEIAQLYEQGYLINIVNKYDKSFGNYSTNEVLILLQTYIYLGLIHQAEECSLYLSTSLLSSQEKLDYLVLRIHLEIFKNKSKALQMMNVFIKKVPPIKSNLKNLARIYTLKASLVAYQPGKLNNLENYSKAFIYLNSQDEKIRLTEILMLIASDYSENHEFRENIIFLNDSEKIVEETNNIFYKGWFLNEKAMSLAASGKVPEAENTIKAAIKLHKQSGSAIKEYYAYSILCKILFVNKKYDEAYSALQKAEELEKQLGFNSPFSYFQFTKLSLYAANRFEDSKARYDKLLENNNVNDTIKYSYAHMLFINKDDDINREKGRRLLKKLSRESLNFSVKASAKKTLVDKNFYYAR